MKKLFSVLVIAAVFAACNNSGDNKEVKPDTTATAPEKKDTMPATPDTTGAAKVADTAAAAK